MARFTVSFIFSLLVGLIGMGMSAEPALATIDDILPPQPSVFTPINPVSNKVVITTAEYPRNFQWESVPAAEWYHIIIVKGQEVQFNQWYQASNVCDDGVCTTTHDVWLAGAGQYTWWMSYWSPAIGGAYHNLYESSTFSISIPLPTPPVSTNTLSGNITDTTPNLNWHNGNHAQWYEIWVGPADHSGTSYQGWHNRLEVCSSELDLCGVTTPNPLPLGDYELWGRSWNTAGTSSWVKLAEFSIALGGITL